MWLVTAMLTLGPEISYIPTTSKKEKKSKHIHTLSSSSYLKSSKLKLGPAQL